MNKPDVTEAVPIVQRLLNNLASIIADKGADGANARGAIGQVYADAAFLCANDTIGPALDNCFDLVRQTGCTLPQMETVRVYLVAEPTPLTLGATLVIDYSIQMALAQEGKIISAMTFKSRQDVDALLAAIQQPFADAEDIAANNSNPMVFRSLIELQAAIVDHLVETARPLPMMLSYQFATPLPSIVISHRLYGDASRYDEIRDENKVVHPAFCPPIGQALSQ
jgi:prophage DNA circulation protein